MFREPPGLPVSRASFPSPVRQTRFLLKAQWSRTETLRLPGLPLPPSLWVLVHLTFTMSSPFLKLCKAPLFPTLPQASHLNKYFLISIIQDFFFLHTDSSFTFKTLTFSCPVAGQPSEWTLHSTPFCLVSPTPQAFLCAPHSRSSLICYSTPMQCRHGLTPSQVISPQHPKHLPFGPLSTQTFSEHTRLDGTSSFRPGSQHLSQQASELKPDCPKPQSEQEVLHVHHGEHSLPQREQGP